MKNLVVGISIALVLAVVVLAQSAITGKWQGQTQSGVEVVLDLTVTGGGLTGTLIYDGQPTRITDGKISKTTFTFKAIFQGQTEGFNGEAAGDRMTFWPDRMGRDRAVILKRVKN
jgi:hypothetical protein